MPQGWAQVRPGGPVQGGPGPCAGRRCRFHPLEAQEEALPAGPPLGGFAFAHYKLTLREAPCLMDLGPNRAWKPWSA